MSSRATPGQVQTVLGPVAPGDLGFTLPHEHTKVTLWHIQGRWDYWELIGEEPRIVEELGAYAAAAAEGEQQPAGLQQLQRQPVDVLVGPRGALGVGHGGREFGRIECCA